MDLVGRAAVEFEIAHRRRDVGAALADRLAGVARFQRRKLGRVLLDEQAEPRQAAAALEGRHAAPRARHRRRNARRPRRGRHRPCPRPGSRRRPARRTGRRRRCARRTGESTALPPMICMKARPCATVVDRCAPIAQLSSGIPPHRCLCCSCEQGSGGYGTDKQEGAPPCQVLACGTLALANLNRLEYRAGLQHRRQNGHIHDKPDHPGRSVRLHHLRRHRRPLGAQAVAGALSPPARPPVFRADADHRHVAQQAERRGVPRLCQKGDHRTREARVYRPGRAREIPQPAELRPARRQDRRRLRQAQEGDRQQRRHPRLLSGRGARAVRRHLRQAQGAQAGHAEFAHRGGKADRPRPRLGDARSTT